ALSYFTGLDAYEDIPVGMIAGDRNITGAPAGQCTSVYPVIGVVARALSSSNTAITWNLTVHRGAGDIARSDGSVQGSFAKGLKEQVVETSLANLTGGVRTPAGTIPSNHILLPR